MAKKTLLIFLGLELLFLGTGAALLATAIVFRPAAFSDPHPVDDATWTLLQNTPLTGEAALARPVSLHSTLTRVFSEQRPSPTPP